MRQNSKREGRDVNTNVHRIFGEMIARSEQPPSRNRSARVDQYRHVDYRRGDHAGMRGCNIKLTHYLVVRKGGPAPRECSNH